MNPLDSRDVKLKYLASMVAKSTTPEEFEEWTSQLGEEVRMRDAADKAFRFISVGLAATVTAATEQRPHCLKQVSGWVRLLN